MWESCGSWQLSQARCAGKYWAHWTLPIPPQGIFARHFHGADYLVSCLSEAVRSEFLIVKSVTNHVDEYIRLRIARIKDTILLSSPPNQNAARPRQMLIANSERWGVVGRKVSFRGRIMKTLWEDASDARTRLGFYVVDDKVLFEYSRPFDTDTWEWSSAKAYFRRPDFELGIEILDQTQECEIIGIGGEKLQLCLLPSGSVSLTLRTDRANGLTIADLRVKPVSLKLNRTVS